MSLARPLIDAYELASNAIPANMRPLSPPDEARSALADYISPMPASDLNRAMEVFARGFAFGASQTYPCVSEKIGKFWVIRDAPRSRAGNYRREEWVTRGVPAAEVDAFVRKHTRGTFCICEVHAPDEDDAPIRSAYRLAGYRLSATEPFMAHRLDRIPRLPEPFPIKRVSTESLAIKFAAAIRRRPMPAEFLRPDSPVRQYVALDRGAPIGWARSVAVTAAGAAATWVADVYVNPHYRRRGIGKSLLARMLRDDREHGSTWSVLLSSHAGALLYPKVGYEMLGRLMLYTPRKK
jgi:GNAT superfamily N-acetyltransferase